MTRPIVEIYSQNMQGGANFGYARTQIQRYDAVLLTESGTPSFVRFLGAPDTNGLCSGVVNFGTSSNPTIRNVIHYPNGRCSLTVIVDAAHGDAVPLMIPAPAPGLRPMVGAGVGGVGIYAFHAPSGVPNFAESVLRAQFTVAGAAGAPFIAGGDGNSDLELQTGPGRTAFVPAGATHQAGGALDGFVASNHFYGEVTNMGMTASDHCGVLWRG